MLLTGNKYEDLTNLTNMYNESGKIILTGNKDVDYQILNSLTVEDLSKVCRMNKYSQLLCNDADFWLAKFKNQNLPLLGSKLGPNEFYDWHLPMWLLFYKRTKICKENAINSFKVYNVQYNNEENPYIYIYNKSAANYYESILKSFFNIIHQDINFIKFVPDQSFITIVSKNSDVKKYNMTKEDIINLLTLTYLYNYVLRRFDIVCDDLPLIITQEYINNNHVGYERYGILNTIKYYNL